MQDLYSDELAMAHSVEIRRIGVDPAEFSAEMRAWLARNNVAVSEFAHSTGGPGTTFRVSFHRPKDARAFARTFNGRMEGADPRGGALWTAGALR